MAAQTPQSGSLSLTASPKSRRKLAGTKAARDEEDRAQHGRPQPGFPEQVRKRAGRAPRDALADSSTDPGKHDARQQRRAKPPTRPEPVSGPRRAWVSSPDAVSSWYRPSVGPIAARPSVRGPRPVGAVTLARCSGGLVGPRPWPRVRPATAYPPHGPGCEAHR